MYLLTITDFIAHLHPVLVHLPIGILLIALILQVMSVKEKFAALQHAIPIVLLAGLISAILSCITGLLLFRSSEYDESLVSWHMWMALTLTFVAFALCARSFSGRAFDRMGKWLWAGLFFLLMMTGHLGGSLTHGEDYLTGALHEGTPPPAVIPPLADVQQAVVYDSVVKPILQTTCYSCHGPNKQKGGLRLDNPEAIAKGGKDGIVLIAGQADSSDLIKRMLLPDGDEHHMPPKDHRQPTRQQQELLSWWIDQGADYHKRVRELPQPEKIRPMLLALQHSAAVPDKDLVVPAEPVDPADSKTVTDLKNAGVVIMPVAQNSNYLSVNFFGVQMSSLISLLPSLKRQLLQLDLSNTGIGDSAVKVISQCAGLRYLVLSNTKITDKSLASLASLPELRVLNLVGTQVTGEGLLSIQPPKHLHALYLYQTHVDSKYWSKLSALYKTTMLDSGGYSLPKLVTDTAVVRPAPVKK